MSSTDSNTGSVPAPVTTMTAISGDMDPSTQIFGKSNNNYIYIYSFLSTLILLLFIALAIFLRALMRRRRLDNQFNLDTDAANAAASESRAQRRRRKRKDYGDKPKLLDAWIGEGPLPTSLSTEALLEAIQPFTVAREPTAVLLNEKLVNEQLVNTDASLSEKERRTQRMMHYLSLPGPASASSCSEEKPTASLTRPTSPTPPVMQEVERVQVGFLIAMPRPPPLPLRNAASSSTLSLAKKASTSTLSVSGKVYAESFWSLAESKWSDHLAEGELPELNVGISTIPVPVDSDRPLNQTR